MKRKTSFRDIMSPACRWESYSAVHASSENGRTSYRLTCPYCEAETLAYIWSLAGTGKRCQCGALFGSTGIAFKIEDGK